MPLPPWLNVSPKDYLEAAQAGAALGTKVASLRAEGELQGQRLASSEGENAARIAAQASEGAANRNQAVGEAGANRAQRALEDQLRYGLLNEQQQRASRAQQAQEGYRAGQLELGGKRLSLMEEAQKRVADLAAQKASSPIYRTVENQVVKIDPATQSATSLFTAPFKPSGGNSIEAAINALAPESGAPKAASGLAEGARVRNKKTGIMGTVKNGVVVPDAQSQEIPQDNASD